jgi:hypothetical protein
VPYVDRRIENVGRRRRLHTAQHQNAPSEAARRGIASLGRCRRRPFDSDEARSTVEMAGLSACDDHAATAQRGRRASCVVTEGEVAELVKCPGGRIEGLSGARPLSRWSAVDPGRPEEEPAAANRDRRGEVRRRGESERRPGDTVSVTGSKRWLPPLRGIRALGDVPADDECARQPIRSSRLPGSAQQPCPELAGSIVDQANGGNDN